MGSWVTPELHSSYAHGNVLMWHQAAHSKMYSTSSYWKARKDKALMPDNMGATWIASSTCDQLSEIVEGAWTVYSKNPNATFLSSAATGTKFDHFVSFQTAMCLQGFT